MGCRCHLRLLALLLVLSNDVELVSTAASSASSQCKSAYCNNRQPSTSQELKFTDKPGPATLAIGCLGRQVDLICCTTNVEGRHISWQYRVDDSKWQDFLSIDPDNRCLSEDNQTASIVGSLRSEDQGMYRCVAYGHSGVVISNEVKLVAEDCNDYHWPPKPMSLKKYMTDVPVSIGLSVDVICSGFFGNITLCGIDCDSGWIRHPFNLSDFSPVSKNSSERVYYKKTTSYEGDQLLSRLHIKEVTDDDYRGSYECWMVNQNGYANTTLVRFVPENRVVDRSVWRTPAIVCGSVLAFVAVLSVTLWPLRHNIQLAVKQRQRTLPSSEGLKYDVLLLHADSDAASEFGNFLRRLLTEDTKPPYRVFHYNRDVLPGRGVFEAMPEPLASSRCVVAVLCDGFVEKYDENWFYLENIITDIDVVYVLYGGLDATTATRQLGSAIAASIKNSRCLAWPADNDAKLGRKCKPDVDSFCRRLKLAIPNRRRRTSSANVDQRAPATSTTPRHQSTESDSSPDVNRRLLPASDSTRYV